MTDEPYALIGHVRICGSPGWVTTQGHPATWYEGQHQAAIGGPKALTGNPPTKFAIGGLADWP